jgi:hypothetical protein
MGCSRLLRLRRSSWKTCGGLAPLPAETQAAIKSVYDELIRPAVHDKW